MTKKLTKKLLIGGLVVVVAFAIALYTNIIKLPIEKKIQMQYVADFNDDRILVGASHNVFAGKVIEKIGERDQDIGPETQFAVEVIYNIKGNLQGTVVVDQEGGYKDGILYLVHGGDTLLPKTEGGDALLQPGATYLFTSRYNEKENWYTLISHPNGRKIISQDENLGRAQLQALAQNDERVKELQEAYKNEILLEADVKNNNVRNSYQALPKTRNGNN